MVCSKRIVPAPPSSASRIQNQLCSNILSLYDNKGLRRDQRTNLRSCYNGRLHDYIWYTKRILAASYVSAQSHDVATTSPSPSPWRCHQSRETSALLGSDPALLQYPKVHSRIPPQAARDGPGQHQPLIKTEVCGRPARAGPSVTPGLRPGRAPAVNADAPWQGAG